MKELSIEQKAKAYDEAVYRYNCRKMKGCDCFRDMFAASIGVVDYKMVKLAA